MPTADMSASPTTSKTRAEAPAGYEYESGKPIVG